MSQRMPKPWFSSAGVWQRPLFHLWSGHRAENPRQLADGERRLGSFILPPFQRPPVWTQAQQTRFLESIWGGLPIGAYVVNHPPALAGPTDSWLIDGQQRITAILAYRNDEFPVCGMHWSDLDEVEQRGFEMGHTFTEIQTCLTSVAKLRDIYDRLAYGGTPHEPKEA